MNHRHLQTSRQLLLLTGIALAILVRALPCAVAEDGTPTVRHRFVPADRPDLWPSQAGSDWVPVRRAELDELLRRIRSPSGNQQTIPFHTATYSAEFDPRKLSLGQASATLNVSSGLKPGSMVLCAPLNLSIDKPGWKDGDLPAVLGAAANGDHFLVIPSDSRELQFDWQLTGTRRLSGVEFDVRVPSAVASVLSLETPRNWTLTASAGTVTHVRDSDDQSIWRVDLGRRTETRLRMIEPGRNIERLDGSLTTASLNSRFELTPLVVNSAIEVSFESLAASVDHLEIQIAEEWQIRSVERVSGGAVLWQDLGLADGLRRLRIAVPKGAVAAERGFVISASLPYQPEQQLQLASPRLVDTVLFDGRFQVALSPPFTLQDYSTVGLSQTDVSAESGDGGRTLLSFQQFAPDARVSLVVRDDASSRARLLSVREFVVGRFDLDPPEFHADVQITARSSEVFSLETWIPEGWEVTRVAHRIADGLQAELSWQVIQSQPDGPDLIQISLPDGLEAGRPALLQISARHVTWSRGAAPSLPAVFPDVNALTSVTVGLLFQSEDDANAIEVEDFERLDRIAGLSGAEWSPIASDLAGQPASLHSLDYWEDAQSRARRSVRLQAGSSNEVLDRVEDASGAGTAASGHTSGSSNGPTLTTDDNEPESDHRTTQNAVHGDRTRPLVTSRLESFVSPGRGGRDLHRMSWKFAYAASGKPLTFRLPEEAVLLETLWNGQPLAASADGQDWTVPVPDTAGGDTLTVSYTVGSKDVYLRDTRRVALPVFDSISASFEWVLRLRKGYSVVSLSEEMARVNEGRPAGWLRWFFGPLARGRSADWFNPISSESWQNLLRSDETVTTSDLEPAAPEGDVTDSDHLSRSWTTVRSVSGAVPQSLAIHICRVDRLHALGWFVLITTCLVGVALRTLQAVSRNRIGLFWLSGCLMAAVVVPDSYAELIGAAILGTVIATLFPRSLIRPQLTRDDASYPSMSSTIALPRAKVSEVLRGLLLVGALAGATQVFAQNGEPALPAEIDVLVPYAGDRLDRTARLPDVVYVDAADLQQLQQVAASIAGSPIVLLKETAWEAIVDRDDRSSVQGRLIIAIAESAGAVVDVPVPASLVDPATPVLLDGQPVSTLPGIDGNSLLIPNPSVHPAADQRGVEGIRASTGGSSDAASATEVSPMTPGGSLRAAAPLLPEAATALDDVSSPVGDGWRIHTIELRLRPETRIDGELRQFSLPIFRVAQSRFQLKFEVPPSTIRDRLTGASVPVTQDGRVLLQPRPDSEIALEWTTTSAQPDLPSVSVSIHSTAEIYPGRHLRQTLATCVPEDGSRVSLLAWRLPTRIRLDHQQIRAAGLVDVATQAESDHTLVLLEFDPPQTEPFDVLMNWQRIAGDGSAASDVHWEAPVSVVDAPVRVSVDSHLAGLKAAPGFRLSNEVLASLEPAQVSTESFLTPWPENARPRSPQIAVRLSVRDRLPIAAQILPIQTQRAVRQNLEARIAPSGIRWTVSAEIETSNAPAFRHELTIPETVRVDSVSLQQDEVDRLSHWERRGDRIVLFLRDRSTGIQTATIDGHQRFDRQQAIPVPAIAVTDSELLASTLQVYSDSELRPVVRGAETVDSPPSATEPDEPSSSGLVGEYRLASGSDVFLELQVVIDKHPLRWLGVVDLLDNGQLVVELAIAVSTQAPGEWKVDLPGWTADGIDILSIDGMDGESSSEMLSAALEGRTLTLSVPAPGQGDSEVRLRLPVDSLLQRNIESGQSVRLVPPICDREKVVPSAIVSRQGGERLGMTGQLVPDLQQEQLAGLVTESMGQSGILNWDTSSEVTVEPESTSVLPSVVLHTVRCGGRITQICRTRVLLNSDVTQVSVRWPEAVQEVYRRIDGQLRHTGRSRVSDEKRDALEVIDLADSGTVHQLEFLWKPAPDLGQLRIRRDTLEFPQITTNDSLDQFVEVVPAADVNVLPASRSDQSRVDQETLLERLSPWHAVSEKSASLLPIHVRQTLAAIDRAARSGTFVEAELRVAQSDQLSVHPEMSAVIASPSNEELQVLDRKPLLLHSSASGEVDVWLVDRHVDLALLGIVVGLAVILPILKFFSLEFGERLAGRPMLSFVLIGLVWWLCLQWSTAGFGVLFLAAIFWAVQSVIRHLPRQQAAR